MTGYHNSNSYLKDSGLSSSKKTSLVVMMAGLWIGAAAIFGLALLFFALTTYPYPPPFGQSVIILGLPGLIALLLILMALRIHMSIKEAALKNRGREPEARR